MAGSCLGVVNCWTREHSLNRMEPCVGAAGQGPNLEFRVEYRLLGRYMLVKAVKVPWLY